MENRNDFFTLGIRYLHEHIHSNAEEFIIESERLKEEYGEEARLSFLKGVGEGIAIYNQGMRFMKSHPQMNMDDLVNASKTLEDQYGEEAKWAFMAGMTEEMYHEEEMAPTK